MEDETRFIAKLIGASRLIEQHTDLEQGLTELATAAADMLGTRRCSIMLLHEESANTGPGLRTYAHYGSLPKAALNQVVRFNEGIAGHVVSSGEPLLIEDLSQSGFASATHPGYDSKTLISTPIRIGDKVIGVINVCDPIDGRPFEQADVQMLNIFAVVVGKSIHIVQLQNILQSRFLQMAVYRETRKGSRPQSGGMVSPDPGRLAKIVAKTIYRELTAGGFGPNQIISVTSEVIELLQQNLQRHKRRREREGKA